MTLYINPGLTSDQVNAKITDAFGTMDAPTGGTLIFNAGIHGTYSESIKIPFNVSVLCEPGCEFVPPSPVRYTQGFLFLVNTTDGVKWTKAFTNRQGAFFDGARLNNQANKVVAKLVCLGAPHMVRNISGRYTHALVHTTDNYLDGLTVDGWSVAEPQGALYQIQLTNLGDGVRIRGGGASTYGIKLNNCQGATILGQIGGGMHFQQCRAVSIDGAHIETATGGLIIENSDVTISNSFIWKRATAEGPRIKLTGTQHRTCVLNNVQFMFNMNIPITPGFDVQTSGSKDLVINNCRSVATHQHGIGASEHYGITVCEPDGTPSATFSAYAYLLSYRSVIRDARVVTGFERVLCTKYANGLPDLFLTDVVKWREVGGEYHYQTQIIFDITRKLGNTFIGGNKSITIARDTEGKMKGVLLPLSGNPIGFIRVYRGTAAEMYDKYVDLPMMQAGYMYDDGVVINGFPWKARTAGAMDKLQDLIALDVKPTNTAGTTRVSVLTAALPIAGTFFVGDRCEIDAPAAGAVSTYRYTSLGWRAETTLAA